MGDAATSRAPYLTPHALEALEALASPPLSNFPGAGGAMSETGSEVGHSEPRLIISIDIGTSQSAVAVFYCERGKIESDDEVA
jgi:hypothetical protein